MTPLPETAPRFEAGAAAGRYQRQIAGGRGLVWPAPPTVSSVIMAAPASLLVLIVVVPIAALVWRATSSPDFLANLSKPVVLQALWITFLSTSASLFLVVLSGTPLAYLLARRQFPGKRLIALVVDLPLVLPPVVAGVALLLAFGRRGLLGSSLSAFGFEVPFTLAAVVLAQVFVAGPFYVRSAVAGFSFVEQEVEEAAAMDGASSFQCFRHITLPLAAPAIAGGAVLCFGRALSEFGATLLFAGNIAGRTQTMSLAIMQAMETDLSAALALSVLLVVAAALVLMLVRLLGAGKVLT